MKGQQFCGVNEEFLTFIKRFGLYIVRKFDTNEVVSEGSENFVNFSDLLLIFEVNRSVEVGDVRLGDLEHQIVLAGVGHGADSDYAIGGSEVLKLIKFKINIGQKIIKKLSFDDYFEHFQLGTILNRTVKFEVLSNLAEFQIYFS